MTFFSEMSAATETVTEKDSMGGFLVDSGVYNVTIEKAYLQLTSSGKGYMFHYDMKTDTGVTVRGAEYVMAIRDGKKCNHAVGSNKPYFGYTKVNAMVEAAIGKQFSELDIQEKVIKLYSYDAKAEVPTKALVAVDLKDVSLKAGIIRQIVDKKVKSDQTDAQGKTVYLPTGETREENVVDKCFDINGFTNPERKAGIEAPAFIDKWKEKNEGVVKNTATGKAAGSTSSSASPTASSSSAPSLFG